MQRYVLSPDEFAWLTKIKETVSGWDEIYDQFVAKFPKCPVDRKKLQRAYGYLKNLSEKPKPTKAGGATKKETKTGSVPQKRKTHEEPNHAKGEGARRVSPRTMTKTAVVVNAAEKLAAHDTVYTDSSPFSHTTSEESIALLAEISLLSRTIRAVVAGSDEAILRLAAEVARTKKLEEELKAVTTLNEELFGSNQQTIDAAIATFQNTYLSEKAIEQIDKDEHVPVATRSRNDTRLGISKAQTLEGGTTTEKTKKHNEKQRKEQVKL
jgi:hypothetical protein